MKKNLLVAFMLLFAGKSFAQTAVDTLVVTTQPQMHCQNCEKKIKSNIRFVRVQRKSKHRWTNKKLPSSTTLKKPTMTTLLLHSRKLDTR